MTLIVKIVLALCAPALLAAKEKPMDFPTTPGIDQKMVEEHTGEGPGGRGNLAVFRDDQGRVGGYMARIPILDTPIHYYDALGKHLGTFHIFGDEKENKIGASVGEALRAKFPHEDDATWLTPIPRPGETSPIQGKWVYEECRIPGLKVAGSLNFFSNRQMSFDGEIDKEGSSSSIGAVLKYFVDGDTLHTPPDVKNLPIAPRFALKGDALYLADRPLPADPEKTGAWLYKLRKSP